MRAFLNLLRQDRSLTPANSLKRWEVVMADQFEVTIGGFGNFPWRMGLKSKE